MGASAEVVMTDKLGRRSGPRRQYSIAEKRSIVEETHVTGASVPEVALRHGVNANLLWVWRRMHEEGLAAVRVGDEKTGKVGLYKPLVRIGVLTCKHARCELT